MNKLTLLALLGASMAGNAQAITYLSAQQANAQAVIEEATKDNAIILFTKASCPFCSFIKPLFNNLANAVGNKAQCIVIDITGNDQAYKNRYNFSTVPTVIYFKNDTAVSRHGSNNKRMTLAQMKGHARNIC